METPKRPTEKEGVEVWEGGGPPPPSPCEGHGMCEMDRNKDTIIETSPAALLFSKRNPPN